MLHLQARPWLQSPVRHFGGKRFSCWDCKIKLQSILYKNNWGENVSEVRDALCGRGHEKVGAFFPPSPASHLPAPAYLSGGDSSGQISSKASLDNMVLRLLSFTLLGNCQGRWSHTVCPINHIHATFYIQYIFFSFSQYASITRRLNYYVAVVADSVGLFCKREPGSNQACKK